MKQVKCDLEKKMQDLGKVKEKEEIKNRNKNNLEYQTINEKLCPFMSDSRDQVACTPQCKLYRPDKKDYECYFMALQTIAWYQKKMSDKYEQKHK